MTPLPPYLNVTRVEADVVAVATMDTKTSMWHHCHPVYLRVTRDEADVVAVATMNTKTGT